MTKQPTTVDVTRTYRRYAPFYDRIFGAVLEPGRRRLTEAVCALAPASILEVGVGTGLVLARYPAAARITGIDLSEPMLEVARRRAAALPGRQIALHAMDAERMDFADHSFDCVTVPYVLSVTPDPLRLVRELRRVCKPGGRIVILNHFSGGRCWWLLERAARGMADQLGFRSEFSYEANILAHDWEVESVAEVNLMALSRLVVIRNQETLPGAG
jgi:phosphatidylethanolamine/phosphatidyl-N-methylethanolamine N-methyltransferase